MKTAIVYILMLVAFAIVFNGIILINAKRASVTDEASTEAESAREGYSFDDLLDAIEWVESKGDPWAVGDDGEAVGAYQIHKIYVDDVNRICKWPNRFDYSQRYSKTRSRMMVKYFLKHYGGTLEEMARKHNGGPQGHKKESTKPYWEKVKARMQTKWSK